MTPILRLTRPSAPKAGFGLPVFAFREISQPSRVPKTIAGAISSCSRPVGDAAQGRCVLALVLPDFMPRLRVESHDPVVSSRRIENVAHHERDRFSQPRLSERRAWLRRTARTSAVRWMNRSCRRRRIRLRSIELPRQPKLVYVGRVDLLQRRIAHAPGIVAEDRPVRLSIRSARKNRKQKTITPSRFLYFIHCPRVPYKRTPYTRQKKNPSTTLAQEHSGRISGYFHSKDNPCMHRDLPRIKSAHPHGAKGAAGTQPGNQSCAGIIYQVRTAETADEAGVIGTVELGVVQQIRGLSRQPPA